MRKIIAATAALALLVLAATPAAPHGPAEWIQRDGIRNAAGELCCGERDCGFFSGDPLDGSIAVKADGYHVSATFHGVNTTYVDGKPVSQPFSFRVHEIVPFSKALPSPTGEYWACVWGGSRKCFFAPPPGS